ncbi:MAG: 2-C-methyl-D-erythritol 4-phosphate cytidylyltransferase [Desulfobacterales bacterium]|nr:2-C-methyl-D-erythritol 4-phosphate cytidylyltransferase [Desulfobacterales bacterium]
MNPLSAPAIIVAAGAGVRMKTPMRKQYLLLQDRPILAHTLSVFEKCSAISRIYLVVPEKDFDFVHTTILTCCCKKKEVILVPGGKERQDSVFNGLGALDDDDKYIVVHDGVRPMILPKMIEDCLQGAFEYRACIMGLPARETIKQVNHDHFIQKTLSRDTLWLAQTPQAFEFDLLRRAHYQAKAENYHGTDDSSLVERLGIKVKMIPGNPCNIKITTPEDLLLAQSILIRF